MNQATHPSAPAPGLTDPTGDAQLTFRAVLDAMAHPGRRNHLVGPAHPPAGLGVGLAAVALTLLDEDTSLWLHPDLGQDEEVVSYLRFHTGVRLTAEPAGADFVLVTPDHFPDLRGLSAGTDESPHTSTTVLLDARGAAVGERLSAQGPGINGSTTFAAPWLPAGFVAAWTANNSLFPRGVDLLVVDEATVVSVPRTTRVHLEPTPQDLEV